MVDLTEDVLVDPEEEIPEGPTGDVLVDLTEEAVEEIDVLKGMRCIQQYVINAVRTVKFLSNQPRENLFTAVIVLKTKAGKMVQDLNLEDHLENHLMETLTKSTKNLTRF